MDLSSRITTCRLIISARPNREPNRPDRTESRIGPDRAESRIVPNRTESGRRASWQEITSCVSLLSSPFEFLSVDYEGNEARTPRISPIACRRKAEGKPLPQFIIHIYLYLLRFPYNVWLFVAKNLSLLSSLNKKEQINTRRDVAERVADGLSAGCGFSFDFAYQSCSTLIGILSSRTSKRKRPFAVSHRNCS